MKTILIDGRWQAAQDERTIDVIDPSNAKVFSSISRGGEADVKLGQARGARHRQADGAGRADIEATARYFEFYGGAADKVHGHVIPS
jgi:aldehyde dehydrogenase (NAD+)